MNNSGISRDSLHSSSSAIAMKVRSPRASMSEGRKGSVLSVLLNRVMHSNVNDANATRFSRLGVPSSFFTLNFYAFMAQFWKVFKRQIHGFILETLNRIKDFYLYHRKQFEHQIETDERSSEQKLVPSLDDVSRQQRQGELLETNSQGRPQQRLCRALCHLGRGDFRMSLGIRILTRSILLIQ
jgi:hypothetical protein